MDKLARLLIVERRLLELLLSELNEARIRPCTDGVVEARARVQEVALLRSMLVLDLAGELDITEEWPALSTLARASVEPYGTIFANHRLALLALAAEVEEVARHLVDLPMAEQGLPMPALLDFLR